MSTPGPKPVRRPTIDDHCIFGYHDQACAVCHTRHAILPCDQCRAKGWKISKQHPGVFAKFFARLAEARP